MVLKCPKLNILFSDPCFGTIVQILSEIFMLFKGVTTLFDGFIIYNCLPRELFVEAPFVHVKSEAC